MTTWRQEARTPGSGFYHRTASRKLTSTFDIHCRHRMNVR
jgi:hypothetical protein